MNFSSIKSVLFSRYGAAAALFVFLLYAFLHSVTTPATSSKTALPQEIKEVAALCSAKNTGPFDGKVLYQCVFDDLMQRDLSILDPAQRASFSKWQHRYDNTDDLNTREGTYKAISKMVADLGEMHTAFLPPNAFQALVEEMESQLVGIGMPATRLGAQSLKDGLGANPSHEAQRQAAIITAETPLVVYPAPIAGTPAAEAGLQLGDRISAVNGKPTIGRPFGAVVNEIRGKEAGTTVELTVERPNGNGFTELNFVVTRTKVQVPQIFVSELAPGYLNVKILAFTKTTSREFVDAVYKACTGQTLPMDGKAVLDVIKNYVPERDCKLKGIVYDLRSNPGGVMPLDMAEAIVDQGPLITMLERQGDRIIENRDLVDSGHHIQETLVNGSLVKRNDKLPRMFRIVPNGLPQVVIVNRDSASASEIFAGILQKNNVVTVVGEPSFGKEVSQRVIPLAFGTGVKITFSRFLPAGESLGVGIIPDFPLAQSKAFLDNPLAATDAQLEKAREVLLQGAEALKAAHTPEALAARSRLAEETVAVHAARDKRLFARIRGEEIQVEQ